MLKNCIFDKKRDYKLSNLYLRYLPLAVVFFFSAVVFFNFHYLYFFSEVRADNIKLSTSFLYSQKSFFITFYAFFIIFELCCYFHLFFENFYIKVITFILGLITASFMLYSTKYTFSLKLFIYSAFIFTIVFGLKNKINLIFGILSVIVFFLVEKTPSYSLVKEHWFYYLDIPETITLSVVMITNLFVSLVIKKIILEYITSIKTTQHQNVVMNQMSELNNKLQEYAKKHGEEAAENERLRITRDMHDSCGYAFVNITAIIDAIMSNPSISSEELSETLLTVRNLASKGLKETRKTLHSIREVENPVQNNISAIYEIRKIFMQITGINVEIASGNIRDNYGSTINTILMHTLQEGLTNAIRHGQAKNIFVSFWDETDLLTMIIKDDGIGAKEVVKGIGFAGMEERLNKVYGKLKTSTPAEGGFRLEIQIPLVNIAADELRN